MGIAAVMAFIAGVLAIGGAVVEHRHHAAQPPGTQNSRALIYALTGVVFIITGFIYLFVV